MYDACLELCSTPKTLSVRCSKLLLCQVLHAAHIITGTTLMLCWLCFLQGRTYEDAFHAVDVTSDIEYAVQEGRGAEGGASRHGAPRVVGW